MKRAGPTLETAAHRILVADWWEQIFLKARLLGGFLIALLLLGGSALVYRVVTADSYRTAAKDVYSSLRGGGVTPSIDNVPALNQSYPLLPTPRIPDPGPPSWA